MFRQWMEIVARWQVLSLNSWMEEFAKLPREKQKHFFQYGLHLIRACYLNSLGAPTASGSQSAFEQTFSNLLSAEGWEKLAADIDKCSYYLTRNAHARLVMMNLSLRFSRSIQEHHLAQQGQSVSQKEA